MMGHVNAIGKPVGMEYVYVEITEKCGDTIQFGKESFTCQREKGHTGLHKQDRGYIVLFWEHHP